MKSGDICDVAAVARNLILQDRVRKISSGERRLLELAKQILVSELVYACDKKPEEVTAWMDGILEKNGFDA
jgi:CarD family transcriptional regulator